MKLAVAPCGSSEKNCWGWEGVLIFRSVCADRPQVNDWTTGVWMTCVLVADVSEATWCWADWAGCNQHTSHQVILLRTVSTDWPKYRDTFSTSTVLFRSTTWCYCKLHLIIWRHHRKLPKVEVRVWYSQIYAKRVWPKLKIVLCVLKKLMLV